MPRFRFGDIVYARFSAGYGNSKPRPALVISGTESNDAGEDLQLLAISTTPDFDCPPYHVTIPPSSSHRLDPGSQVKCNWAADARQSDVIRHLGSIDDETLQKVVDWFDRLYADESFTDWQ